MFRVLVSALLSALAVACSSPGAGPDAGLPEDAGTDAGCPEGAALTPDGLSCAVVEPPATCPVGTFRRVGQVACVPVGVTSCLGGLHPAVDGGWGCEATLPPEACGDGGLALPGDATCRPLGDCAAAFPPAAATFFVDDDYLPAQLDATHFQAIGAAMAAAPRNAVIAVEAGTYVEALSFARPQQVVGRCAAQVQVVSPGGTAGGVEPRVRGAKVKGLTFRGHRGGAVVVGATDLLAEACDFADNRDLGLGVFDSPAQVTLEGCVVRDTRRMADGSLGRGLDIEGGAAVVLRHTLVEGNAEVGVFATDANTTVELTDSLVWRTAASGDGTTGRGVYVKAGAKGSLVRTVLAANHDVAAYVSAGVLDIADSLLVDTRPAPAASIGRGLSVNGRGTATLRNTTVRDSLDDGVEASSSRLTLDHVVVVDTRSSPTGQYGHAVFSRGGSPVKVIASALVGSQATGVVALDAATTLLLQDSLVADTQPDGQGQYGFGLVASDARVTVRGSSVLGSRWAGLVNLGGQMTVGQSLVSGVKKTAEGTYGHGVLVLGTGTIDVGASLVERAEGVALLYAGGQGVVTTTLARQSAVGVNAQGGTHLVAYLQAPAVAAPQELALDDATRFEGNGVRVGSVEVPVPPLGGVVSRP